MKNKPDGLFFHTAICAENVTNSLYPTRETALAAFSCASSNADVLGMEDSMKNPKGKYAWTVTVGEKGQIVIPKQAREIFGIKPGDSLVLLGDENKGLAIPPKSVFARFAAAVFSTMNEDDIKDNEAE